MEVVDPTEVVTRAEIRVQELLASVTSAARLGDLRSALRLADAALRRNPRSPELLQLVGDILLASGQPACALERLQEARFRRKDPDIESAVIQALLALDRVQEATDRLQQALGDFAVSRGDRLASAATALILHPGSRAAAWVGSSPRLDAWGEIVDRAAGGPLRLETNAGEAFEVTLESETSEGRTRRFTAGACRSSGAIEVRLNGEPLIGARSTLNFDLDGRSWWEGHAIKGWASLGWAPREPPLLTIVDGVGRHILPSVFPHPTDPLRHQFTFDLRGARLSSREVSVCARLPDGHWQALPDSPILTYIPPPPAPGILSRANERLMNRVIYSSRVRAVDVIIAVQDHRSEALACLSAVQATVDPEVQIIVVNDASSDPGMISAVEALPEDRAIVVLNNRKRLGLPASVNRGLALHRDRDAVILDAGAEVFPGWLEALRAAAQDHDDVGMVTPLSNSGSIASYPKGGLDCDTALARDVARHAGAAEGMVVTDAPVGAGLCMFIRRECLNQTGFFDATCFGEFHGGEDDFCARAARLGWRHVVAANAYVRRIGRRSPGEADTPQRERSLRILNQRHAGHDARIQEFEGRDPLWTARRSLDEALLKDRGQPIVLIVTLDLPGGVRRFVNERVEGLRADGFQPLLVRPARSGSAVHLEVFGDEWFQDLRYERADYVQRLIPLLADLPIEAIEFHHFLDLDPEAVDLILGLQVAYDVYVHDYLWICPRITLVGADGRYCGEPDVDACESCLKADGGRVEAGLTVHALRSRSARWLAGARRVITPAWDVALRLRKHFNDLEVLVQPWEAPPGNRPPRAARAGNITKVAVIGGIGDHKGYQVLLACANDAIARNLPLEFVLIGFSHADDTLLATGRIFITGEYEEAEVGELIEREDPDVALFASIWPEPWCFALGHALRANLPIMAFDLGAIADRLRNDSPDHQLAPPGTEAREINDRLLAMKRRGPTQSPAAPPRAQASPDDRAPQPYPGPLGVISPGVDSAAHATPTILEGTCMTDQQAKSGLIVSGEILPLNKGVYRFSVEAASPQRLGEDGELTLPAIHIGVGPGVAPENIELMTGLRTDGAWLYEHLDMLVIKVRSSPTPVLVTSVRSENMAPLDVSVERIDGRKPSAPALSARTAPAPWDRSSSQVVENMARASALADAARNEEQGRALLRSQTLVHVTKKGDLTFVDAFWAGAMGESLPIEGFSISPLERISPQEIEYKALAANGAETPWTTGGELCGTRGLALPLVGFAIRLKTQADAHYECEYRGAFKSGKIVGPISSGAPCRALVMDDHLVGIQITLAARVNAPDIVAQGGHRPLEISTDDRLTGPRFSIFRENT